MPHHWQIEFRVEECENEHDGEVCLRAPSVVDVHSVFRDPGLWPVDGITRNSSARPRALSLPAQRRQSWYVPTYQCDRGGRLIPGERTSYGSAGQEIHAVGGIDTGAGVNGGFRIGCDVCQSRCGACADICLLTGP